MSFMLNIVWFLLGGFLVSFFYLLGGVVLCLTIVGIPFGVQLFKLSALGLSPFGKEIDTGASASGLLEIVMNVLWWIFGGVELAMVHLVFAVICAVTIIGIPLAKQHVKLLKLALVPFGARIR